jgi:hypothetical protein
MSINDLIEIEITPETEQKVKEDRRAAWNVWPKQV